MSGFNQAEGIFELTHTKAQYWFRRDDCGLPKYGDMGFYADVLQKAGFEVLCVEDMHLKVYATPGQVWTALSGRPSNPEREAVFYR